MEELFREYLDSLYDIGYTEELRKSQPHIYQFEYTQFQLTYNINQNDNQ